MPDDQMWIGTKGRERWMPCPLIDADVSRLCYSTATDLLSGEVSIRQSVNAHRVYDFEWRAGEPTDRQYIMDLADGLFDAGTTNGDLVYFHEPTTMRINALPPAWAAPFVQAIDAPPVTRIVRPTITATITNTYNLPLRSAVFPTLATTGARSLYIPIPPGFKARWAFYGPSGWNVANNGVLAVNQGTGLPADGITPIRAATAYGTGWTYSVTGSTGVTLTVNTALAPTITAGIFQIYESAGAEPATPTSYVRGWGHAGCVIQEKPSLSIGAIGRYNTGARLVEVGARR